MSICMTAEPVGWCAAGRIARKVGSEEERARRVVCGKRKKRGGKSESCVQATQGGVSEFSVKMKCGKGAKREFSGRGLQ